MPVDKTLQLIFRIMHHRVQTEQTDIHLFLKRIWVVHDSYSFRLLLLTALLTDELVPFILVLTVHSLRMRYRIIFHERYCAI